MLYDIKVTWTFYMFFSSGWSFSWSDHGLPSSPPALLSQTLLWTLQTSQPGPFSGWSGGRSVCMQTYNHTHSLYTVLRPANKCWVILQCSGSFWPLCDCHIWATRAPSMSNNSSSCASYILTWHFRPSSRITVATYTQLRTEPLHRKNQYTFTGWYLWICT